MNSSRVIILDRDGTLVPDLGYLANSADMDLAPGVAAGLHLLHQVGHRLIVITNQSGVGRGYFPLSCMHEMNDRLHALVEAAGARLEHIYFCPHAPEAGCACRKPAQGLMKQACSDFKFRSESAVVIGDRESDIEFGRLAGAATILIHPGSGTLERRTRADYVVPTLFHAALRLAC